MRANPFRWRQTKQTGSGNFRRILHNGICLRRSIVEYDIPTLLHGHVRLTTFVLLSAKKQKPARNCEKTHVVLSERTRTTRDCLQFSRVCRLVLYRVAFQSVGCGTDYWIVYAISFWACRTCNVTFNKMYNHPVKTVVAAAGRSVDFRTRYVASRTVKRETRVRGLCLEGPTYR